MRKTPIKIIYFDVYSMFVYRALIIIVLGRRQLCKRTSLLFVTSHKKIIESVDSATLGFGAKRGP